MYRQDVKCGRGAISQGERCTKGTTTQKALTAAALSTAAATGLALIATRGRRVARPLTPPPSRGGALVAINRPQPVVPPTGTRPSVKALPGARRPAGYLSPAAIRKSKTQRMQENVEAQSSRARARIAQTAREEVRRIAQIGNTMAETGEAAGMATKLTFRNLRLRAEAARRRYEPGYRKPKALTPEPQKLLPESGALPVRAQRIQPRELDPVRVKRKSDDEDGNIAKLPKEGRSSYGGLNVSRGLRSGIDDGIAKHHWGAAELSTKTDSTDPPPLLSESGAFSTY